MNKKALVIIIGSGMGAVLGICFNLAFRIAAMGADAGIGGLTHFWLLVVSPGGVMGCVVGLLSSLLLLRLFGQDAITAMVWAGTPTAVACLALGGLCGSSHLPLLLAFALCIVVYGGCFGVACLFNRKRCVNR